MGLSIHQVKKVVGVVSRGIFWVFSFRSACLGCSYLGSVVQLLRNMTIVELSFFYCFVYYRCVVLRWIGKISRNILVKWHFSKHFGQCFFLIC